MGLFRFAVGVALVFASLPALAQKSGTAGGKGRIVYFANPETMEKAEVAFSPKVAWAYADDSGPAGKRIHVLLAESEAPVVELSMARDRANARRKLCAEKKAPFVDLELNDAGEVELLHQCGAGHFGTEMVSTLNGLDSVVVALEVFNAKRVKGTLRGGEGWCGDGKYCEQTEDYSFDAPLN
ncbi:MAG: hypothetical protein KBB14_12015 [Thermoanaerobaculia bacterium]|jgi:hypothetical protein|nr:hypothetical protein [Thermoanaerobaculia bacterium]